MFQSWSGVGIYSAKAGAESESKFQNPYTSATVVDPTVIYPCFYSRNDHTDFCYCRNWKVTPDPGPFFHKFLTPDPGPKGKRRILSDSTLLLWIRCHLWYQCHKSHEVCFIYRFCLLIYVTNLASTKKVGLEKVGLVLPYLGAEQRRAWTGFQIFWIRTADSGFSQQDQEWGFLSCSRIWFGFCFYWKIVTGCLLDLYLQALK